MAKKVFIIGIVALIAAFYSCSTHKLTSNQVRDRPTSHQVENHQGKTDHNKITVKNAPIISEELHDRRDEYIQTNSAGQTAKKLDFSSMSSRRTLQKCSPSISYIQAEIQPYRYVPEPEYNTEEYAHLQEDGFKDVIHDPLSTFSIDVDVASYSNIRRFLTSSQLPPHGAVRIEEMINYFSYDYPQPEGKHPFSITTDRGHCPWNEKNQLVHIGIQGKNIPFDQCPPSNLVFLLDVSGSMSSVNKLPLLKSALKLLVKNLRSSDRVAIVVYAGSAGLVLPSTAGNERHKILSALDRLQSGGSTASAQGIRLAYSIAKQEFLREGNNRVILATDGDFNIGVSSESDLVSLIEQKRNDGIFLTVLGFGTGNYKDNKMEKLANKGNGNYAYIDNLLEAKKVLVNEMGGTLFTIAKDVKIQVEFNPAVVQSYRLIGYENRRLNKEDFNDDTKDAGELGAGHTVTALYEIVPVNSESDQKLSVDPLKYQKTKAVNQNSGEILTVKFRYKKPDQDNSILITRTLENNKDIKPSKNLQFSAAVASFGMLLRGSRYMHDFSYEEAISLAKKSRGEDTNGYRSECIRMMELAQMLSTSQVRLD